MYNDFVKPLVEAKEKMDAMEKRNAALQKERDYLRRQLEEERQLAAQQLANSSAGLINAAAMYVLANGMPPQKPIRVSICIGEQTVESEVHLNDDD